MKDKQCAEEAPCADEAAFEAAFEAGEETPLWEKTLRAEGGLWDKCRIMGITSLGQSSVGYNVSCIGFVVLLLGDSLSASLQGAIASAFLLGALAGQMLFATVADLLGPRPAGLLSTACVMVGSCITASAGLLGPMSAQLIAGRVVVGLGAGAEFVIPASLAAALKSNVMDKRTLLLASGALGSMMSGLQFLIVFPMLYLKLSDEVIWRSLLAAGGLPATIVFGLRLGLSQSELKALPCAPQSYLHDLSESLKGKKLQFFGLCVSWSLFAIVSTCVMAFGPLFLQEVAEAGQSNDESFDIRDTASVQVVNWLVSFIAILFVKPVVDYMGLKGATVISTLAVSMLLSLCVFFTQHYQQGLSLASLSIVGAFTSIPLAACFALAGEMFGAGAVGFYVGIAVSCQKAASFFAELSCPILLERLGPCPTLLIAATCTFLSCLMAMLCLPGGWLGGRSEKGGTDCRSP